VEFDVTEIRSKIQSSKPALTAMHSLQGVWEKDPVRGEDSFEAFEEVLFTATDLAADAVLLGG
jgi:hypothetical protein